MRHMKRIDPAHFRLSCLALLLVLSVANFASSAIHVIRAPGADFQILWSAAERYLQGKEIYLKPQWKSLYLPGSANYKWPPAYLLSVVPWATHTDEATGRRYNCIVHLLFFAGAVLVSLRSLSLAKNRSTAILAIMLALNFAPFFETLLGLQAETPILLLLVLTLGLLRERRDVVAGFLLGICVLLKLYPAAILVYFLFRRRWRVLFGASASIVIILAVSIAVFGFKAHHDFFLVIFPRMLTEMPAMISENLSVAKLAYTGHEANRSVFRSTQRMLATKALMLPFWLLSGYAIWQNRRSQRFSHRETLEYSMLIPLVLLSLPNSWLNYQLLLLLPILALLGHLGKPQHLGRRGLLLLVPICLPLFLSDIYPRVALGSSFDSVRQFSMKFRVIPTVLTWVALWLSLLRWRDREPGRVDNASRVLREDSVARLPG